VYVWGDLHFVWLSVTSTRVVKAVTVLEVSAGCLTCPGEVVELELGYCIRKRFSGSLQELKFVELIKCHLSCETLTHLQIVS
jgi:hypothetical protein